MHFTKLKTVVIAALLSATVSSFTLPAYSADLIGFWDTQRKGGNSFKEGANKQVISSQADSLIKISRIWADFFPANTSNQPV